MTKKRVLCILVCLVLCLSLLPMMAFAAADTTWHDAGETEFTLMDADDLFGFASLVNGGNTFAGKTVKLGDDIDLGGAKWAPIGGLVSYPSVTFAGTFDGQGKTVSNFTVNETGEYATAGLFGSTMGTIKNLTVSNATVKSEHYAAGIVAYTSSGACTVMNCTVKNSSIVSEPGLVGGGYDNGDKVGGILGYNGENGTVTGCTVENVSMKAYRDVGGIVGCSMAVANITDNTVKDITILVDQKTGYYGDKTPNCAEIIGRTDGTSAPSSNTAAGTNTIAGPGDPVPEAFAVAKVGTAGYLAFADAVAAANEGDNVQILKAGTYKLPNLPKNITVTGAVDGVVIDATGTGSIASVPNGATFDNLTFNFGTGNYHGFQHAGDIAMKDCTLNGLFFSYGNMAFDGCTFNAPGTEASGVTDKDYSMWAYGFDLTFTDCTFNCAGKCINVYCETNSRAYNVTASGCTFNSTVTNKAAFNVKETCGSTVLQYVVTVTDCTANENFPAASDNTSDRSSTLIVFNPLVQVDDRVVDGSVDGGEIRVVLDGRELYETRKTGAYYVTFNMNGHGTDVANQMVTEGSPATKPAEDPTEEGWMFEGWYVDADGSAEFDFDTAITADTTIFAKWTEKPETLEPAITITAQPKSLTVTGEQKVNFSVTAEGENLTYQWQQKKPGSSKWANCVSTTGTTNKLVINAREAVNGYTYRCTITSATGTVISEEAKLTMASITITSQPKSLTVLGEQKAKFTVSAEGENLTYQWQQKKPGAANWTSCVSATGKTAKLTINAREAVNGYTYRCVISCGEGKVISDTAKLTVAPIVITAQPKSLTVTGDQKVKFTVSVEGENLTYQWQQKKPGADNWTNCVSATGKTAALVINARAAVNGYIYRCVITGGDGRVVSGTATLTVK